jgi:cytochrome P450
MNEQFQPPKGTPLFNPWTPEFIADPYPFYYRLRETDPMHLMPLGLYIASRHSDVTEILRDKRFGKDFIGRMTRRAGPQIVEEPVYRSMSHWMLQVDPPDHGRLRSLVLRAFSARRRYAAAYSSYCRCHYRSRRAARPYGPDRRFCVPPTGDRDLRHARYPRGRPGNLSCWLAHGWTPARFRPVQSCRNPAGECFPS